MKCVQVLRLAYPLHTGNVVQHFTLRRSLWHFIQRLGTGDELRAFEKTPFPNTQAPSYVNFVS
jgi:hypothetical protein